MTQTIAKVENAKDRERDPASASSNVDMEAKS